MCHTRNRLRTLSLLDAKELTDGGLRSLALHCPSIISLDLGCCDKVTDRGLAAVASSCQQLTNLNVDENFSITNAGLQKFSRLSALSSLSIKRAGCLEHTGDVGITPAGLCTTIFSSSWPSLQFVDMSHHSAVSDAVLEALGKRCSQLRTLNLEACEKVCRFSIHSMHHHATHACLFFQITDTGLSYLAEGCGFLECIGIRDCKITDAGLSFLAARCAGLLAVDMGNCATTDLAIEALALGCRMLVSLDSSNCNITDRALVALSQGCCQLGWLDVSRCERITDTGIEALASTCQELFALHVAQCTSLSDSSLAKIGRHCRKLSCLTVNSCERITDSGIELIAHGCPQLMLYDICSTGVVDKHRAMSTIQAYCPEISRRLITSAGTAPESELWRR